MGTILASATVTSARASLLDPSPGKTWTDARFLVMYNQALRRMVTIRKDLYTVMGAIDLQAGVHQVLAAGATQLFKLIDNVASGKPIAQVSESLLIEENRWAGPGTASADVEGYAIDARDPLRFIITPPSAGGTGLVRALYGSTPSIAALTNPIPLDDIYEEALRLFLMAEAYRADTTRQDLGKTTQLINEGTALLGVDDVDQAKNTPPLGNPGGS